MILGMIGTQTIIIVMVVALLIFGPQKLPEVGRQIGQAMRELRKMSGDMTKALDLEQHVSMDTSYDYNSYSNYTDSSHYRAPIDQYGLTDGHDADHANPLVLAEAPKSLTLAQESADLEDGTSTAAAESTDDVESTPDEVTADALTVADSSGQSENIDNSLVDTSTESTATSDPEVALLQPVVSEATGAQSQLPDVTVGNDQDV